MDNELQVWELIMAASWLVKLVKLLLLVASVASWVIIFRKRQILGAAVKEADLVMVLVPDEQQPDVYHNEIAPNIKKGATLAFAHGFNIHYGQIAPRADLDVIMVAPKGRATPYVPPMSRVAACLP